MLRHPSHPSLCLFHARAELQLRESHELGTELSSTISSDFMTATDINRALGKLYTAVAQDRLPAGNAATLAYIGQLLLQSVDGVKSEFRFSYKFDQWNQMTQAAKPLSPPTPVGSSSTTQSSGATIATEATTGDDANAQE